MIAEVLSAPTVANRCTVAASPQVHESTVRIEESAPGLSRESVVGRLQLVLAVRRQARIQDVLR